MIYGAQHNLTFGIIAEAWAREGPEGCDDILHRLLQAVWRGDFETGGESLLSIMLPGSALEPGATAGANGEAPDLDGAVALTRRGLVRVLELKGILPPLPALRVEADEEMFTALAALLPFQFGNLVRMAYLEAIIVSRDDFGRWCDRREYDRPNFWFAAEG